MWRNRVVSKLPSVGLSWTHLSAGVGLVARKGHRRRVRQVSEDAWLVEIPKDSDNHLSIDALDECVSVLQRRGGRRGRVDRVAADAWLVQSPKEAKNPITVEALDEHSWVLQRRRGRRLAVKPIGRKNLRTHLLVDTEAVRRDMRAHQMALGKYLAEEHIPWILRALKINCVLDVGANVGQFGQRLRSAGYEGRIVSFEPLPHAAERLRRTAAGDPDWHVVECALGDTEREAEMTVAEGLGVTSSLLEASEFGKSWSSNLQGTRRQPVQIRRLDQLFDDAVAGLDSPRVYLKMDTQGYDLQTFAGAGERIRDVLGMQSEVASVPIYEGMARLPEQISAYEAAGFENTGMFPVTRDRKTLRVIEFDVVMVRPDAVSVGR